MGEVPPVLALWMVWNQVCLSVPQKSFTGRKWLCAPEPGLATVMKPMRKLSFSVPKARLTEDLAMLMRVR